MNNHPSLQCPFKVMEGLPSGSVLGAVTAKDPDEGENGTVYYSLSGGFTSMNRALQSHNASWSCSPEAVSYSLVCSLTLGLSLVEPSCVLGFPFAKWVQLKEA